MESSRLRHAASLAALVAWLPLPLRPTIPLDVTWASLLTDGGDGDADVPPKLAIVVALSRTARSSCVIWRSATFTSTSWSAPLNAAAPPKPASMIPSSLRRSDSSMQVACATSKDCRCANHSRLPKGAAPCSGSAAEAPSDERGGASVRSVRASTREVGRSGAGVPAPCAPCASDGAATPSLGPVEFFWIEACKPPRESSPSSAEAAWPPCARVSCLSSMLARLPPISMKTNSSITHHSRVR
mmetsp:Transcript_7901/g.20240  ORF Transcript_7901/g.20240 Transcript_7901/m.20240 type:complete len:242 (-) Transcript_7901:268-993(-)